VDRKWIWASLAIIAMWAAVVLVGVFGPNLVVDDDSRHVEVPALPIVVALCAFVCTIVVAWRGYAESRAAPRQPEQSVPVRAEETNGHDRRDADDSGAA
jgi:type VI protein secretion system component VasK